MDPERPQRPVRAGRGDVRSEATHNAESIHANYSLPGFFLANSAQGNLTGARRRRYATP